MVTAVLLVGVSVWNVGYDLIAGGSLRSFRVHSSDGLMELMADEGPSIALRFDVYILLGRWGAGRTLVAPPDVLISDRVDGLADMTLEIEEGGVQPDAAQIEALLALPGVDSTYQPSGDDPSRRVHIIPPGPAEERMRVVVTDDVLVVVGENTLSGVTRDG
jgi:hypothetical protein